MVRKITIGDHLFEAPYALRPTLKKTELNLSGSNTEFRNETRAVGIFP